MKKFLSILLFGVVSTISTVSPVLAENYNYKLYNPNTNEVSSAVMMSVSGPDSSYIIGFVGQGTPAPCIVYSTENKGNGLLGGGCAIMGSEGTYYSWKEYKQSTFNQELNSIIEERKAQGKYLPDEVKRFYTVSE